MIDTLLKHRKKAAELKVDKPQKYALVTLHRPSNVDDLDVLRAILQALEEISKSIPVIFPIHPRTAKRVEEFGLSMNGIRTMAPLGYLEFLNLMSTATIVLTDSGGLQEESTFFRTPCLTLRPNTERPVTIEVGSNRLTSLSNLRGDIAKVLGASDRIGRVPPLWDGHTAERIITEL